MEERKENTHTILCLISHSVLLLLSTAVLSSKRKFCKLYSTYVLLSNWVCYLDCRLLMEHGPSSIWYWAWSLHSIVFMCWSSALITNLMSSSFTLLKSGNPGDFMSKAPKSFLLQHLDFPLDTQHLAHNNMCGSLIGLPTQPADGSLHEESPSLCTL